MRILYGRNDFPLRLSIVSITAGILLAACGGSGDDGPPPSISVSSTSIDADVAGGNVTVSVSNGGGRDPQLDRFDSLQRGLGAHFKWFQRRQRRDHPDRSGRQYGRRARFSTDRIRERVRFPDRNDQPG